MTKKIFCAIISVMILITSTFVIYAVDIEENWMNMGASVEEPKITRITENIPFGFEVLYVENGRVIARFVTQQTGTVYLGEKGQKAEVERNEASEYVLEPEKEYSLVYSCVENEVHVSYFATVAIDFESETDTSVELRQIYKKRNSNSILRSIDAIYETNAYNETMLTAQQTYDYYDTYGQISSTSDIDWWKFSVNVNGGVALVLDDIPSGSDFDIFLCDADYTEDSAYIATSVCSGNTPEAIDFYATAGEVYYLKIMSYTGTSNNQNYELTIKSYPDSVELNVPLYSQEKDYTCGFACARMVLGYHGVNKDESDLETFSNERWKSESGWTHTIARTTNYFLTNGNTESPYWWYAVPNMTNDQFSEFVMQNLVYGYPIIALMKNTDNNYFPYCYSPDEIAGHYVVIKGIEYDFDTNEYNAIVNDPHYEHSDVYSVPLSSLLLYIQEHHNYGYVIALYN